MRRSEYPTPIDALKPQYESAAEHLRAIEDALAAQFHIHDRVQLKKAVQAAFEVGHRTTTTDDWADTW